MQGASLGGMSALVAGTLVLAMLVTSWTLLRRTRDEQIRRRLLGTTGLMIVAVVAGALVYALQPGISTSAVRVATQILLVVMVAYVIWARRQS